ncbi:MAG: restriction endonuclease subunit R [Leptolyngbyaceae bacterium]|nr:restriction endonuclease subunit R [Leptolyngbyaceae bacterium]
MVQTIPAEKLTLYELEKTFHLQRVQDTQFFPEWQSHLPKLTAVEKQQLDRAKAHYLYLATRPMLEEMVKMVVISPLLDLAGFYEPPFYSTSEKSVKLSAKDDGVTIRGKIDVLVIQDQLWVLVLEAKQAGFSLQPGIPQALAYMLANPQPAKPLYGLVSNGSNFIFLKLLQPGTPQYALSNEFTLMREDEDFHQVLRILKRLAQVVGQTEE